MKYGRGGTIHQTTDVNVELDKNGKVVSVWFRGCPLSFTQSICSDERAKEMRRMYAEGSGQKIVAIETLD